MALSASTTLPHGVDSVTAVFANEDFQRHTSEYVGGTLESFTVAGDIAGEFSTTSVRTLPTTRLPEIARKFVGESLKVTQVENWDAPAADGSRPEHYHPEDRRRADRRGRSAASRGGRRQHAH